MFSGLSKREIEGLARLELTAHAGAIRIELVEFAEKSLASLLVTHEGKIAELSPRIVELAKAAASQVTREYTSAQPNIPEIIKRELAASSVGQSLLGANKGQWKANVVYAAGDIIAFRGSSYLVLRPNPRGEFPGVANQKEPNPIYQLLAAAGSPGPAGLDLIPPGLATLTDAATIDWNMNNPVARVTLGGARAITFSNPYAGSTYILMVKQDAGGSRTLTWPGTVLWPGGTNPVLTTTAAKTDVFYFVYDGTNFFGTYAQNF
jgi:hypothetical protein